MMTILQLMFEFAKTGLFAVGGGLATLPFLYEMAAKTNWFTNADILNLVAVSESTPGAIGINMATYVGYLTSGPLGGVAATVALAAPSIVVIILISKVLNKFKSSPAVQGVFKALRPASTALITSAGLSVAKMAFLNTELVTGFNVESLKAVNWMGVVLAIIVFVGLNNKKLKKLHPIVFIAFAAVVGVVLQF